jgi:hypothetical protein
MFVLSIGCVHDLNGVDKYQRDYSSLYGRWKLIKVEGGFHPNRLYNGEVIWVINTPYKPNMINVIISDGIDYPLLPPDSSGHYTYLIKEDTLILKNDNLGWIEKYPYTVNSLTLTLGDISACGLLLTFERTY